jgi:hypothetical protein
VNNGTIPMIRQELQKFAMDLVEEMERRFKTFEEKMLQTVGAEMMRMRTEVENAIVTLATHVANAAQRQRVMEDGMSAQMAAVLAQSVSPTSTHIDNNSGTAEDRTTQKQPKPDEEPKCRPAIDTNDRAVANDPAASADSAGGGGHGVKDGQCIGGSATTHGDDHTNNKSPASTTALHGAAIVDAVTSAGRRNNLGSRNPPD